MTLAERSRAKNVFGSRAPQNADLVEARTRLNESIKATLSQQGVAARDCSAALVEAAGLGYQTVRRKLLCEAQWTPFELQKLARAYGTTAHIFPQSIVTG